MGLGMEICTAGGILLYHIGPFGGCVLLMSFLFLSFSPHFWNTLDAISPTFWRIDCDMAITSICCIFWTFFYFSIWFYFLSIFLFFFIFFHFGSRRPWLSRPFGSSRHMVSGGL